MTHQEFKEHLKKLDISLKDFSILIDTPYSTVAKYGKSNPVPSFVKPFLMIYKENQTLTTLKKEIKEIAKKL